MAIFLVVLVALFREPGSRIFHNEIPYSQFLNDIDQHKVRSVYIAGNEIRGEYADGAGFLSYAPYDPGLIDRLQRNTVTITARPEGGWPWLVSLLISWLPFFFLIGVWILLTRRMRKKEGR
jgi:cell division protease FtsH